MELVEGPRSRSRRVDDARHSQSQFCRIFEARASPQTWMMFFVEDFVAAFPDLEVTLTEVLAEGDRVVIWYTARGTHRGEFEGIPATGKRVNWVGADLLRIDGAKIAEGRFLDDSLQLLRQLRPQ